jgi:hypothetical protein
MNFFFFKEDTRIIFEFNFDILEDESFQSFQDFGQISTVPAVSFPQTLKYKPDDEGNPNLDPILTDVTSISIKYRNIFK